MSTKAPLPRRPHKEKEDQVEVEVNGHWRTNSLMWARCRMVAQKAHWTGTGKDRVYHPRVLCQGELIYYPHPDGSVSCVCSKCGHTDGVKLGRVIKPREPRRMEPGWLGTRRARWGY
jgi:hypothetical protein